MSIFGSILGKIFHSAEASVGLAQPMPTASLPTDQLQETSSASTPLTPSSAPLPGTLQSAAPQLAAVDVQAVLTQMASNKGGGGNWQTSIVDLLKLLDLNSSLSARKDLANELDTHIAADGSAEENNALHKAVMKKLAENGGKVPESMMA